MKWIIWFINNFIKKYRGAYAIVKRAVNRQTGEKVAIKIINKQVLEDEDESQL